MAANEQQRKESRETREPAHHARRPMNAFLIFCKRHRGSVRSGFPHLENRAVTRVLGEWWATLHPDQKRSYTNLAQEYKDAFLNANPDFKWYKLPAPPLRTLNTRPTNKKSESNSGGSAQSADSGLKSEYESSDCTKPDRRDGQSIQPGKLADESQIGGLSSLFTPQKTESSEEQITINGIADNDVPKPPKKRYTESPFQSSEQKRDCKADLFGDKKRKRPESNNNEQHETIIEDEKHAINAFAGTHAQPEENNFRSERTCKGLRYQKFLAEQMKNIGPSGQQSKRRRTTGSHGPDERPNERRNSISSNVSEKTDSLSSEGGNSSRGELEHLVESAEGNMEASRPEDTETEGAEAQVDYGPWTARKRFRAEDFNLEKKIEALPSLSLEEFQEKKKQQRTKKKKILQKVNASSASKRHQNNPPSGQTSSQTRRTNATNESSEESEKAHLVGSQKRKARKQSITRNAAAINSAKQSEDQEANKCKARRSRTNFDGSSSGRFSAMGVIFLEHIGGARLFSCASCDTNLTNRSQLVSTRFTGATGRAFLFNKVVNLNYSEVQDRVMLTGRHMVRDVSCKNCDAKLGWVYEFATDEQQRYKEGRVILERALVTESDGLSENI